MHKSINVCALYVTKYKEKTKGYFFILMHFFNVFSPQLVQEVCKDRHWGQRGSPWEFNLRDLFRWCQLMQADQAPGFFNPGQHVALVYADRMRTESDKAQVNCFTSFFIAF